MVISYKVTNESIVISNGDKLDILSTINSVYGYFAIKGGFKLKEIKGSVSTLVRANIGPNNGHKLNSEDKNILTHQAQQIK